MIRLLFALLLALPTTALAADLNLLDVGSPTLDLPGDFDLPTESVSVKEVQTKTGRALVPPLKVMPLALGLPLTVAGLSVANTSPIAYGEGLGGVYPGMRSAGLSIMGGALAANFIMNSLARTAKWFGGGKWHDGLGFYIGGISAALAGYALVGVGTNVATLLPDGTRLLDVPGATGGVLAGASVAWTVGNLLLIIDAIQTAYAAEPLLASAPERPRLRFAGAFLAPNPTGGATAGLALTW